MSKVSSDEQQMTIEELLINEDHLTDAETFAGDVSALPEGWSNRTLQAIGLPKTPNIDPSNFPHELFELYSVPSYSDSKPDIILGKDIGSTKQFVQPGDVLLCKIVPHLVRVWCVPKASQYRQIASGEWIVVRPNMNEGYNEFIRYALIETRFRREFMETVSGVGGSLMRARPKAVAQISIFLPPLNEQRRIVATLDRLFARTQRAWGELERVPRLVERSKQAVLEQAFSGELTREWKQTRDVPELISAKLGDFVLDIRYGTAQKCYPEAKGTAVLRIPNVSSGRINLVDLKYADLEERELSKLHLEEGDILVIRSNGSVELVGRPALVTASAVGLAYAGYLIRLRPNRGVILPEFLALMLETPQIRSIVEIGARSTTGVHNINSVELAALHIPKIGIPEQREIVRRIEAAFARIDRMAAEAARATALLDRLEQATLAKAFRGEL